MSPHESFRNIFDQEKHGHGVETIADTLQNNALVMDYIYAAKYQPLTVMAYLCDNHCFIIF